MPTATIHPQPVPIATMSPTAQPRVQLRRAVYVHISDLTSAYNIDHTKLEEELARAHKEQSVAREVSTPPRLGVPTELDTTSQRRLQPPRNGYNLCVLVGEVNIVVDKNRVDGTRVRLAEVEVGDETGVVWLRARDEQIDLLQQVSSRSGAVVLRNCTLELYQGKHIRLAITKWGKLSTYPDQIASTPPPPSKINTDRNFSLIDLSVVASEMVAFAQVDSYHTAVEAENQPGSVMNRAQPYHSAASMSRRGRRPQQMGKPASAPAPMGLHYGEQGMASPLSYPSAMHSYASNYSYPPGQQEALSSGQQPMMSTTQQMLFQQQYEMQHRQMQQMYQSPQDRLSSSSPMISPGVAPNVSFDSTFSSGGDVPMHTANPFTMQSQVSSQQKSPSQPPDASGTMNPRAATFDPYRKPYGK